MTSKVLVKLPTVPFPQGKKPSMDIVPLPEKNEGSNQTFRHQGTNMDKVAQLEQNMKFLQEEHQATLVALHQEVESLRQKNRDLQFQLVFSKGSANVPSSPSSPEDSEAGFAKPKGSPVCVNITPLQVELLERDLQDTKISLQEAKTQNQQLSEIIEQQKKKLDVTEEQKVNKQSVTDVGIQVISRSLRDDLIVRVDFAESMVKQLHRENKDQREEIASLKAVSGNTAGSNKWARYHDKFNRHYNRGSPTSTTQDQAFHKLPPLQSQSYWHHRALRCGRIGNDKQDHQPEVDSPVFAYPFHQSRVYRTCNENGKYKRRVAHLTDSDNHRHHHHHRRDYKDRNSKDHEKELVDSVEGSREPNNSSSSKS